MTTRSARRRMARDQAIEGTLLTRELTDVQLQVRQSPSGDRIIEGRIVPFGVVTTVQDRDVASGRPVGRPYREVITGLHGFDPTGILLESQMHRGALVGRSTEGRLERDGAYAAFRVSRTVAGDELYELARDGVLTDLSIEIDPASPSSRRSDGVMERSAIVHRVAVIPKGAYPGAQITAVRAGLEAPVFRDAPAAAAVEAAPLAAPAPQAPATVPAAALAAPVAPAGPVLTRGAAEREAVVELSRNAAGAPAYVTRDELMYGPGSGRSFFRDGYAASRGDAEAADRQARHYRMLEDLDQAMQRAAAGVGLYRAGDVLSSEIPGAYPSLYLPGLIVNRILKQRPMASFYTRVPVDSGQPRIFPVVSTSTSVAVQSAEGANPAASDFATTATTVTPLLYGGETKVARQVLDGADPSIDTMLQQDLTEAYMQASETVVKTAVEAGSTASGVALTAATPNLGLINLVLNHFQNVFLPAERLFLPTTLYGSWLTQLDTTNRPLAPFYGPMNTNGIVNEAGFAGAVISGVPVAQSWASTAGAGAGVGGVAVVGREADFAIFESNIVHFRYTEGAEAPSAIRVGLWAYLVVGTRRGSRKATGA